MSTWCQRNNWDDWYSEITWPNLKFEKHITCHNNHFHSIFESNQNQNRRFKIPLISQNRRINRRRSIENNNSIHGSNTCWFCSKQSSPFPSLQRHLPLSPSLRPIPLRGYKNPIFHCFLRSYFNLKKLLIQVCFGLFFYYKFIFFFYM